MTQTTFSNGHALLIGVGADLSVTVKDATALRDVLVDPNRAAYPTKQVELLTEQAATRQGILNAFDRLIERVNQNPDATVIVYFSGHGGRIKSTNEYFLVPYGYDQSRRAVTAVSGLEFTKKIEAIKARKLVVLLDCCHAGGVPGRKDIDEAFVKSSVPPTLLETLEAGSGRVVVASSHANEESYYIGTGYSVFTNCLLEALQGKASAKKDGYARILNILDYLFDQVPKRAPRPQNPFVNEVRDLSDNFPLCYYAGGSKFLPGEVPISQDNSRTTGLTAGQRRRLEQKRDMVQRDLDLQNEKVQRMRKAVRIKTDPTVVFQLEQELLEEQAALTRVELELEEIQQALQ